MSGQNHYRRCVISRLAYLEQLDGQQISQEERQDAYAYATGKEPNRLVLDPHVLLESTPNALTVCSQIKIPLKVMSMSFDSLRRSQATLNGSRGRGWSPSRNQNMSYESQKEWELLEARQTGSMSRKGSQGENELFMLPFQTFLKNISPREGRTP